MYFYICGCDVAHSVIHSFFGEFGSPGVSPCLALRADKRSYGVVDTPATTFLQCASPTASKPNTIVVASGRVSIS